MKILHINTSNRMGGAGNVANMLCTQFPESHLLVNKKYVDTPFVIELGKSPLDFIFKLIRWIFRLFGKQFDLKSKLYLNEHLNSTYRKLRKQPAYQEADIIHLHNLHGGYFDLAALKKICAEKKVVWTLHDKWAITGGDVYFFEDTIFKPSEKQQCVMSYYPLNDPWIDGRKRQLEQKKKLYAASSDRILFVPVSEWLLQLFKLSPVYQPNLRLELIRNGINTSVFQNQHRRTGNIPRILFFNYRDVFKGSHVFLDIINRISIPCTVYCIGEKITAQDRAIQIINHPFIANPTLLAELYNQVDLLVFPSLTENFPLTVLEAMACGVAVIASDVGGIPEIITSSELGVLFPVGNSAVLLEQLTHLLQDPERLRKIGTASAAHIQKNFSLETMAEQYANLYKTLVYTTT